MPNISFLIESLNTKIIRKDVNFTNLPEFEGIVLLKDQSSFPADFLYIGEPVQVAYLIESGRIPANNTVFVAGDSPALQQISKQSYINLIVISADLIDLYNHLNSILKNYQTWSTSLLKALCKWRDIPHLVNLAASILKTPIFLLNSEYKVIYGNTDNMLNNSYADEIHQQGELSQETISFISKKYPSDAEKEQFILFCSKTDTHCYFNKIVFEGKMIANLFIASKNAPQDIDVSYVSGKVADCIKNLFAKEKIDIFNTNTEFHSMMKDIIELELTDLGKIEEQLKLLKYPLKTFFQVINIDFFQETCENIPYNYIVNQLEQLFPENNVTAFGNSIVIISTYAVRNFQPDLNDEKFNTLLTMYNAYAGVSNGTRDLTKIRTMYLLAKSTARLGKILHKKNNQRIYSYEELSTYHIIDLCAERFKELFKHDDIIYLTHPGVIALTRYDRKYNNNLRDVLFYYLINGRNIQETSKVMYMHRNTVQNKIHKITQIIGQDLNDGKLQLRLLFSCLVMRYYEEYQQMELHI